jgi:soluble lytic murein transglycosylase
LGLSYYVKGKYEKAVEYLSIVKEKRISNLSKAIFYLARSFEGLKNYEKAKETYLIIIDDYPKTEFAPQAFYQYYLLIGNIDEFKSFEASFKKHCSESEYYNKYIWDLVLGKIKLKDWQSALNILNNASDNSYDLTEQAKILFWQGKLFDLSGNSEQAKIKFKECVRKYPFSYYTYRILTQYLVNYDSNIFRNYIKDTKKLTIEKYSWLYDVGLKDLAIKELEAIKKQDQKFDLKEAYMLSYLYFLDKNYYESIKILAQKVDIHAYFQKYQEVPRSFLELLYPLGPVEIIKNHATFYNKEPELVLGVIRRESAFKHNAYSRSNAIGFMQIMPKTGKGIADQLAEEWRGEKNLEDKDLNIKYGTYYLTHLAGRFNNNYIYMLSAYNAGPNRTQKWINEIDFNDLDYFVVKIPYDETQKYVPFVLENYWIYKNLYQFGDEK